MKILAKIFKIIGVIVLLVTIVVGGLLAYDSFESNKRKRAELAFAAKKNWHWYDEYDRIQIQYNDKLGKSILRKVNMHDNYVVYAYKTGDYELVAMVKFIANCNPNTSIETSKKYSDGKPIILKCNEEGDALKYVATWEGKDIDFV